MRDDISKILLSEKEIKDRVKQLGAQISEDYKDKNLVLIGVLKGCVMFMADLIRAIDIPIQIDFMSFSSYAGGIQSTGKLKMISDISLPITNRDVLMVEDILDSGLTLNYVREFLAKRSPSSFKVVTLLNKQEGRKADINADYVGFDIPNEFVIGYGLDYDERYRNLPMVGILKPETYMNK